MSARRLPPSLHYEMLPHSKINQNIPEYNFFLPSSRFCVVRCGGWLHGSAFAITHALPGTLGQDQRKQAEAQQGPDAAKNVERYHRLQSSEQISNPSTTNACMVIVRFALSGARDKCSNRKLRAACSRPTFCPSHAPHCLRSLGHLWGKLVNVDSTREISS